MSSMYGPMHSVMSGNAMGSWMLVLTETLGVAGSPYKIHRSNSTHVYMALCVAYVLPRKLIISDIGLMVASNTVCLHSMHNARAQFS